MKILPEAKELLEKVVQIRRRIGIRNESKRITPRSHNSKFDLDENSMAIEMTVTARTAIECLEPEK